MRAFLRQSPLVFEPDPLPATASSHPAPAVALPKRTLKCYQQLLVGAHIAYSSAEHPDRTFRVGKVTHLMQAELSCAVHRMGAQQDGAPACPFPTFVHRCGRHGNHVRG